MFDIMAAFESPDGVFIKSFLKCCKLTVLLTLCMTADAAYGYDIRTGLPADSFIIIVILLIVSVILAHLYRRTKRSERSLIKSEKKLKDITSSLAEGIYVLNEQGHVIFMNPEAEHLLGWTFTELAGKNAHEIIHCEKSDGSPLSLEECPMRNVIRTGIPFVSRDEFFTRKDGRKLAISVVASPIKEKGTVVAAVTAFRDI